MKWFFRMFFTLLLLIGWLVIGYLYVDYTLETPKRNHPITVEIAPKTTIEDLGEQLQKKGLIRDNRFFRLYVRMTEQDKIVAGVYEIQPDQDLRSIMEKFTKGKQDLVVVRIPEGKNVYDIAEILAEAGYDKEAFLKEVNRQEPKTELEKQIPNNPKRKFKLEGYLFPTTYEFRKDATMEQIVTEMVKQFEVRWKKVDGPKLMAERQKSLEELVIIASLVEREARSDADRPPIAGVIYNRLNKNMPLQIDASTIYAFRIKGEVKTRLFEKDYKLVSPYNLYPVGNSEYQSLPPGPIANPGEGSLLSALKPENHKYYYYIVSKEDPNVHEFFTSYQEFLNYKNSR